MNVAFLTDYYAFHLEGLKELWSRRLQPYTLTSVLPKIQISLKLNIKLKRFSISIIVQIKVIKIHGHAFYYHKIGSNYKDFLHSSYTTVALNGPILVL